MHDAGQRSDTPEGTKPRQLLPQQRETERAGGQPPVRPAHMEAGHRGVDIEVVAERMRPGVVNQISPRSRAAASRSSARRRWRRR